MEFNAMNLAIILGIGIMQGFLNTVAGGGTLLVLPALSFLGVDIAVANATNRIAIIFQSIAGATSFNNQKVLPIRTALPLAAITSFGSVFGALLAVNVEKHILNLTIACLISIMAILLVFNPKMWETKREKHWPKSVVFLIFFLIGVYGGFIQAGIGFFFAWALALAAGADLVVGNAIKTVIIGCYNVVSLLIFMTSGLVDWSLGIALAVGSVAGAVIGANFAVARGNRWLRWILAVVVVISAAKMFIDTL
jgi:hypothetical protein